MFLIPLHTDRRLTSIPWVNITLIAANVLVFVLQQATHSELWRNLLLNPLAPSLTQFLSYQFLHHDLFHIGGNMIFLWTFGNNVEDRLGKVGYLLFYLAGGTIAGLGYCLGAAAPVLGASGSVAAVTGAFLVLFPNTRTTIFYWLIIFGVFEISSVLLLGFQIGQNLLMLFSGNEAPIAYMAHLSGYSFGILIAWGLLWGRLLRHEPYDLMGMYLHRKRRMAFANLTRDGYTPWDMAKADTVVPKAVAANATSPSPDEPQRQQIALLRGQVLRSYTEQDLPQAGRFYAQLLDIAPAQVFSQQQQLDLANQLMNDATHDAAARAYELYLNTFTDSSQRQQVQLLLGLIYTRYVQRHQRARELLTMVKRQTTDESQKQLIATLLAELPGE